MMPEKETKKKKKKSFLHKFSRAFGKTKRRDSKSEELSTDESDSVTDDDSGDPSSSSRSRTPIPSPRRKKEARDNANRERESRTNENHVEADGSKTAKPGGSSDNDGKIREIDVEPGKFDDREIFRSENPDSCSTIEAQRNFPLANVAGSDKYIEAKKLFMENSREKNFSEMKISSDSKNSETNVPKNADREKLDATELRNSDRKMYEKLTNPEVTSACKLITKLIKSETAAVTDSDSDDWTDSDVETDDESTDFIAAEKNEMDYGELYFTTGKFITYFFLQMERQGYDPNEVYTIIRYYDDDHAKRGMRRKAENSSSGSTSPNIPSSLRRRLLHRRSVDNLIANSPTNSMRHSSPESIRSAPPVPLKPRSTSQDGLSKKKGQTTVQSDGASMDSLAKQSLLAAQVLNLIPTNKARERNFLHGRVAANSLLGPVELEKVLPNREIKIFVGTWNMNGQTPPKELNDFMLPSDIQTVPDVLAIGTQESCSERGEWEAALQETLGPSHVLLTSTGLGTLHLALFLRRDLIWFCSVPEDDNFSTRPGTAFRTKGAVALALMLFGTSFLFVTAHLTAHQEKVKERVNDIKRIVRNLELPKDLPTRHKSKDVTQNFDCVFWCGDLNFRLAQPREEVIQWVSHSPFPRESPINLHKDQLRTTLNEGAVLRGFEEAPITFPPTYKYDPGTQNFDSSSKQRTPAYTDRILFKGKAQTRGYIRRVSHESTNSHKDGNIECLIYDSVPSICTSDHKPVWGVFKTYVRPGIDTIPLAAGMFNRDVYLEGIRRRAAAMDDSQTTTRACSIQ